MTHFPASPKRHSPGELAWLRRLLALAAFGVLALSLLTAPGFIVEAKPALQFVIPDHVVISEFRVRGSAGGNDEFIELFNPTSGEVDISGWIIQRSNDGGTISTHYTFPLGVTLQSGQFYLLTNSSSGGYDDGITGDANYGSGITDSGGLALFLADGVTVVDQVGFGTLSAFGEGTKLTSLGSTSASNIDRSYQRLPGNMFGACVDTNDNFLNFVLSLTSNPRNSSTILSNVCQPTPTPTETPVWERLVLINEVAWGGTQADGSNAQWIELYNPSLTNPVPIDGWRLIAGGGAGHTFERQHSTKFSFSYRTKRS